MILATKPHTTGKGYDTYDLAADAAVIAKNHGVATCIRLVRMQADLANTIREENPVLCIVGCGSQTVSQRLRQLADRLTVSVYLVK